MDCAAALLEAGAPVDQRGSESFEGWTALMCAAAEGHAKWVKALAEAGADVNALDVFGRTALMIAAEEGQADCVKALVSAGAQVNASGIDGVTALMRAAEKGKADCVKALVDAGADVDAATTGYENGQTALMLAARNGHVESLKALVAAGASLEARHEGAEGRTALMYAAWSDHADCVKALVEAGAKVNAAADNGWTALGFCRDNEREAAKALRDAGIQGGCVPVEKEGRYLVRSGSCPLGYSWEACLDKETGSCTARLQICGSWGTTAEFYEIGRETYEALGDSSQSPENLIRQGRALFRYENDRNAPENATVYDEGYRRLLAWSHVPEEPPEFTSRPNSGQKK